MIWPVWVFLLSAVFALGFRLGHRIGSFASGARWEEDAAVCSPRIDAAARHLGFQEQAVRRAL